MRKAVSILIFVVAGCVTMDQERFRDYNEDGVQMFRLGRYQDARESFQAAMRYKPDDPGLIYNIGQCYDRAGRDEKAEQAYRTCLNLAPEHAPCRYALATLMLRQNRRDEVGRFVENWLIQSKSRAEALALDGWYLRQVGDVPRAQARLQQALELEPHNVLALTEMGQIYESLQRPDRALVLYQKAKELDPDHPELASRIDTLVSGGAGRPRPE